jgi:membrane protein
MTEHGRLEELDREGSADRTELAADLAAIRSRGEAWKRAARPWLVGGAVAAVVAGSALAASRLRSRSKLEKTRRVARKAARALERHRPRPIPMTILFALLKTPTVRRALTAGAGRLVARSARADEQEDETRADGDGLPAPARGGRPVDGTSQEKNAPAQDLAHGRTPQSPAPSSEEGEEKAAQTLEDLKRSPFKRKIRFVVDLFRQAFADFNEDEALTRGAALAYYTLLSLAPLLVVVIAVAGLAFGADQVREQILAQIGQLVGADAARTIATLMQKASKPSSGIIAAAVGVVTLLLGAGGVFGYLHGMLNKIWKVPEKKTAGIWHAIQSRFLSLAMVLGTGFLLLVSLVVSAALSALGKTFGDDIGFVLNAVHQIVSWAVIGVMFALIFRFLPDTRIAWRDVWIGAGITSLLFVLGQFLIGLYLGHGAVASVYGGAGSLVIVLLWTYYSGLILFFGAEVTHVFATRWGSRKREVGGRESGVGSRR